MGRLTNKVAIVTGAGSGIGAGTAKVMGREGAQVLCADLDLATAEATAKEIAGAGGVASAVALDVRDKESNDAAAATVASDEASFITGGAYPVDGGITATLGSPPR